SQSQGARLGRSGAGESRIGKHRIGKHRTGKHRPPGDITGKTIGGRPGKTTAGSGTAGKPSVDKRTVGKPAGRKRKAGRTPRSAGNELGTIREPPRAAAPCAAILGTPSPLRPISGCRPAIADLRHPRDSGDLVL